MGSYQFYEFQAIDRSLDDRDREKLRKISSRAEITSRSMTNVYNYGDFRGDSLQLMERWFDLHLYIASWGTRRMMIRLPARLADRRQLERFVEEVDEVQFIQRGQDLIVEIEFDDEGSENRYFDEWEQGDGWLDALAPLRADLLAGDHRLLYVLWLTAVENNFLLDDAKEPLPGIGPLSSPLRKFAEFFDVDSDLVQAAAASPVRTDAEASFARAMRRAIQSLPDAEKTALLVRLVEGDVHVGPELRNRIRAAWYTEQARSGVKHRTVAELRKGASAVRQARARKKREEQRRKEEEARRAQRARLDELKRRGDRVWDEVEREIESKNAKSYDRAIEILKDLQVLAREEGKAREFYERIRSIRSRHPYKEAFLRRLTDHEIGRYYN